MKSRNNFARIVLRFPKLCYNPFINKQKLIMSKSTKSIYTYMFKNKPKKVGYYIRVTDMDTEPVFIGSTVNEGFENFEARFPEAWADKQWWVEKCLHVSVFGDFTWDNFDHSDKFI